MAKVSEYEGLSWLLARNHEIAKILDVEYADNKRYFPYLDDLVGFLRTSGVTELQEKLEEAGTLEMFRSSISELEIARALASEGKGVKMVIASTWTGQSPDLIARDSVREVYVEVKRITENEAAQLIVDGLRQFLVGKPFRIDIGLSPFLSQPTFEAQQRQAQDAGAQASLQQFIAKFEPARPAVVVTDGATFLPTGIDRVDGYPGMVRTAVIAGDEGMQQRLIVDAVNKAQKRSSWLTRSSDIPYLVAFDCEEVMFDDVTIDNAFLGVNTLDPNRIRQDVSGHPKVVQAIQRGWRPYLERSGLIYNTTNHCYLPLDAVGLFLTSNIVSHLSGILVRRASIECFFRPNPFCDDRMNDPTFETFLPQHFEVRVSAS